VNRFQSDDQETYEPLRLDPTIGKTQMNALAALRAARDPKAYEMALRDLAGALLTDANLLPFIKNALLAKATIGEICDVMRSAWGVYRPSDVF
jgi:methylmalonyl-CoA mutase N-terminal domain/subunit